MNKKRRTYDTITKPVQKEVRRLRQKFPELGHEGIISLLREADMLVDETELREWMEEKNLNPGPTAVWVTHPLNRRFRGLWGLLFLWRGGHDQ